MAKQRDERGRFIETEAARARKANRAAIRAAVRRTIDEGRKAGKESKAIAKLALAKKRALGGFYSTTKAGKTFFYPAIVEYGSEHHPAQAPMRKAFDSKKDDVLLRMIASIREGIADVGFKRVGRKRA